MTFALINSDMHGVSCVPLGQCSECEILVDPSFIDLNYGVEAEIERAVTVDLFEISNLREALKSTDRLSVGAAEIRDKYLNKKDLRFDLRIGTLKIPTQVKVVNAEIVVMSLRVDCEIDSNASELIAFEGYICDDGDLLRLDELTTIISLHSAVVEFDQYNRLLHELNEIDPSLLDLEVDLSDVDKSATIKLTEPSLSLWVTGNRTKLVEDFEDTCVHFKQAAELLFKLGDSAGYLISELLLDMNSLSGCRYAIHTLNGSLNLYSQLIELNNEISMFLRGIYDRRQGYLITYDKHFMQSYSMLDEHQKFTCDNIMPKKDVFEQLTATIEEHYDSCGRFLQK